MSARRDRREVGMLAVMTSSPWTFGDESEPVGPGTVTLVNGTSFAICERSGDVTGRDVQGVFVADTRVCSNLVVLIDGRPTEGLAVSVDHPSTARFIGRSADRSVIVRRTVRVDHGGVLDIELRDRSGLARDVSLEVVVGSDLAGLFEVKEGRASGASLPWKPVDDGAGIVVVDDNGRRGGIVRSSPRPDRLDDGRIGFTVALAPRGRWACRLELVAVRDEKEIAVGGAGREPPVSTAVTTTVESDIPGLALAFEHAVGDLAALQLVDPSHPDDRVVAAGAPWFMTLFGRDSILTSLMALPIDPDLGLATARTLARLQGRRTDLATEEQPGRILHEVRFGTGSSLSLDDAERYFGTVDATPLFVVLVHELWRWGAPWSEVQALLPAVDAALDWVDGLGDRDGDGFVEYERQTEHGLRNQGWKDSWDAICFDDGRLAEPPIALCEVQAYAYAAWRAGAALAAASGDPGVAARRGERATRLARAFDDAFWLADQGWYALALDRDKRPVDALASNLGHLLWCGIVPPRRVSAVADALLSPELASGWGVRTLATSAERYDPLGYHTGSVWPHDTAIAVAGLRRAGCVEHATRLATALLTAAKASGGRLPELFAGLGPDDLAVPVPYPASCSPQAWASAAPLLVLRALLGLEPDVVEGRIVLDPVLPKGASYLRVTGIPLGAQSFSLSVEPDTIAVWDLPRGVSVYAGPDT